MNPSNPKNSGVVPSGDIARRVAKELRELRKITTRIEGAVGGLMRGNPDFTKCNQRDLQSLDMLGQSLDALALFLDGAAEQMSEIWKIDPAPAAAAVTLLDLAARLASASDQYQHTPPGQNGECGYF